MKKAGLFALWIAIAAECVFLPWSRLVLHAAAGYLTQPLVFVVIFAALAVTRGRVG